MTAYYQRHHQRPVGVVFAEPTTRPDSVGTPPVMRTPATDTDSSPTGRASTETRTRPYISTNALDLADLLLQLTSVERPTVSRADLRRGWDELYPEDNQPRHRRGPQQRTSGSHAQRRIYHALRTLERHRLIRRDHDTSGDSTVTVLDHTGLRAYAAHEPVAVSASKQGADNG